MSEIYFNNITNEILLSTTSGNTIVLEKIIPYDPVDGYSAFWKLNQDSYSTDRFIDEFNSYEATDAGATFTTDHSGNTNGAVIFDGNLELVNLDAVWQPTGATSRTICFWFYGDTNLDNADTFFCYGNPSSGQAYIFDYETDASGVRISSYGSDVGSGFRPTGSTWVWMCSTYDGTTTKIYADNVEILSASQTLDTTLISNEAKIGGNTFYGAILDGYMSSILIYNNKVLTSDERSKNMNNT